MLHKIFAVAVSAGLLAVSAIAFANENEAPLAQIQSTTHSVVINPASPATYMAFLNPATHAQYHDTLLDPSQWSQFVQPGFFMQMANPQAWTQWMNPASYQVMMNPNTYLHWINPATIGAEMNSVNPGVFMNPANYQQFLNGQTYAAWWNPATYDCAAAAIDDGVNWFNMNTCANPYQPAPLPEAGQGEG